MRQIKWVLIVFIFLAGCSSGRSEKPAVVSVPVAVNTAVEKNVPSELRAIGNVQALSTVHVKSRIGGELIRVTFTEGQDVKKGDLLFTIDPRPHEAALKQAEANLARDLAHVKGAEANLAKALAQVKEAEANLAKALAQVKVIEANLTRDLVQSKNAGVEANRYRRLYEKGVVAREQYDRLLTNADAMESTVQANRAAVENAEAAGLAARAALENAEAAGLAARAALENAEATVRADRAALENVRIQLGYCFIHSPMEGRTGSLIVQRGNVVKADDAHFVVINQITPIYVTFSVPEQYLPEIKKYMAMGKLKVEAVVAKNQKHPEEGVITFVDNAVDSNTGTIRLKGTFPNREKRLWPGQFVNAVLTLSTRPNAVVVPSRAVQTGQQGQHVFVAKPDLTVELRPVTVGTAMNDEVVIEKGVAAGEKVVTDGQLRLFPGARVEIKNSSSPQNK